MSSVDQWPAREPGTVGVGCALSSLGVAALSFAIGALRFGYGGTFALVVEFCLLGLYFFQAVIPE